MSYPAKRFLHSLHIGTALVLGLWCSVAPARAQVTMQVFVDPHPVVAGGTIGFTYAGNKFVGSVQRDGLGVFYATDLDGTNLRVFAPTVNVPVGSLASEHHVASSFGLGGFPRHDIYVGAGSSILHVANDGASSDTFVANIGSPVRGILFDLVGTFGNDMMVSTFGGRIYRVNSAGAVSLLASVGEDVEGMDIVPLGAKFGSFDGQLVVAAEKSGLLRAVIPSGKVTILNGSKPIPSAESVNFVPLDLGASGSPVEGFYEANYQSNVLRVDRDQFASFKGDALVTSELGDRRITRVHWNGVAFEMTIVGTTPNQAEDGIFVSPKMLDPESSCLSVGRETSDFRDSVPGFVRKVKQKPPQQ
jgi:hypothetical protein